MTTQVIFFAALLVCVLVSHGHDARTEGISFYGVYPPTVPILVIGYGAGVVGLWRLSSYFREDASQRVLVVGFRAVSVMLVVLLLTPFNLGPFWNWAHMIVGIAGALVQFVVAVRILQLDQSPRAIIGFSIQLLGGVLAALSLPDWRFDVLLAGQIILQVGFGLCLVESTSLIREGSAVVGVPGHD